MDRKDGNRWTYGLEAPGKVCYIGNLESFLHKCLELTLPETNIIASENWWLGDYFTFGFRPIFRDELLGFREGMIFGFVLDDFKTLKA